MNTGEAREVFKKYAAALVYVEVESPTGDLGIGTAFHVGEGVFVTARHVVEGKKIVEVGSTESVYVPLAGAEAVNATTFLHINDERMAVHLVRNGVMRIESGPYMHSDERVDVAVFKVHEIDPRTPVIPLGSHLDDWLGGSDFVLTEAVILGYPPIPMTTTPALVGARAEISPSRSLRYSLRSLRSVCNSARRVQRRCRFFGVRICPWHGDAILACGRRFRRVGIHGGSCRGADLRMSGLVQDAARLSG
ncbi:hypothetical protein GRC12_23435 [Streptomyces griseorubiginosus]|nr:hypothetical protein [Streptomyces griseorubiginosus]